MIVVALGFLLGFIATWIPVKVVGTALAETSAAFTDSASLSLSYLLGLLPVSEDVTLFLIAILICIFPAIVAALILGLARAEASLRTLLVIIVAGLVGYTIYREGLSPLSIGLVAASGVAIVVAAFAARFVGFILGVFAGAICVLGVGNIFEGKYESIPAALEVITGVHLGVLGNVAALAFVSAPYLVVLTMLLRRRST